MKLDVARAFGDSGERVEQLFVLAAKGTLVQSGGSNLVLLLGTTGVGKTFLLLTLAKAHGLKTSSLTLGRLAREYPGDLAFGLLKALRRAHREQPSLLILDNCENLFPVRNENFSLSHVFSSFSKSVGNAGNMLIVGTSCDASLISPRIRSRFEAEITLDVPTAVQRLYIFQTLISEANLPLDADIAEISHECHGYLPSDITTLVRKAISRAKIDNSGTLTRRYLLEAKVSTTNSSLQPGLVAESPSPVYWSDIGGLVNAKAALEESVVWIYKHADAFARMGVEPSRGILLTGPPGTGKTLLAQAVATESSANFLPVKLSDLIKAEVGESEKAIKNTFAVAKKCSPCVIFLDELEAIFGTKDTSGAFGKQLISQLLLEMDNLQEAKVVILAATNIPEAIDPVILRPGKWRLDRIIYVGPPNREERIDILKLICRRTRITPDTDLHKVADCTMGYTGADLTALIRKAGLTALQRSVTNSAFGEVVITQDDVLKALESIKATQTRSE